MKQLEYDELLTHIGEFGTFQKRTYFLICLVGIPAAFYNMIIVFVAAEPDFWCKAPTANHLKGNLSHEQWLRLTAPFEENDDDEEVVQGCKRYAWIYLTELSLFLNFINQKLNP